MEEERERTQNPARQQTVSRRLRVVERERERERERKELQNSCPIVPFVRQVTTEQTHKLIVRKEIERRFCSCNFIGQSLRGANTFVERQRQRQTDTMSGTGRPSFEYIEEPKPPVMIKGCRYICGGTSLSIVTYFELCPISRSFIYR